MKDLSNPDYLHFPSSLSDIPQWAFQSIKNAAEHEKIDRAINKTKNTASTLANDVYQFGNELAHSDLAKNVATSAAIGAAVAIPIPIIGPATGAALGAGLGIIRNIKNKANRIKTGSKNSKTKSHQTTDQNSTQTIPIELPRNKNQSNLGSDEKT